jgi:hypothetical protein
VTISISKTWSGSADPTQPTDFTSSAIVRGVAGESASIACTSGPANVTIALFGWCELSLDGSSPVPAPFPPAPPPAPPSTYTGSGPTNFTIVHYPPPAAPPGSAPAWFAYLAAFSLTPGAAATPFNLPVSPGVVYPPNAILNAPSNGTALYASAACIPGEPGARYQVGLAKSVPQGNNQRAWVAAAQLLRRTPATSQPMFEVHCAPIVYVALVSTSASVGSVFDFAVTLS